MRNYPPDSFGKRGNRNVKPAINERSRRMIRSVRSGAEYRTFSPPEDWHEPLEDDQRKEEPTIITQPAGDGYTHVLTAEEVRERICLLPKAVQGAADVVQLSRMTRKKKRFPCYGMQWGTAVYLYPVEENLEEYFEHPLTPNVENEMRKFGARIKAVENNHYIVAWTAKTIRDFYLNNILIHEWGHLVDDRNTQYEARERYAEWYAEQYGFLHSDAYKKRLAEGPSVHTRRHHST